ncbi:hypothetical protein [Glycomyces sp. NPDC047010]|uniref:hypothetical protein n=1 Tax=Glycomyces sp. NPDC047010 TaxID=3155023 RepID=UPI00340C7C96
MTTEESRLAEFCRTLPQIRAAATQQGWLGRLEQTVTAIGTDAATAPAELAELWRFLGLETHGRGPDVEFGRSGQMPTPPPGGRYVCPHRVCTRYESRVPGEPIGACDLFGESLAWQR